VGGQCRTRAREKTKAQEKLQDGLVGLLPPFFHSLVMHGIRMAPLIAPMEHVGNIQVAWRKEMSIQVQCRVRGPQSLVLRSCSCPPPHALSHVLVASCMRILVSFFMASATNQQGSSLQLL
jgi:hypothetical protein